MMNKKKNTPPASFALFAMITLRRRLFRFAGDRRRWLVRTASLSSPPSPSPSPSSSPPDDEASPSTPSVTMSSLPKGMVRSIAILTGSQLCLNLGFSQIVPVLPLFAAQIAETSGFEMGAFGVGLIIAAPSASRLFLNVPLGRAADTIGRKPLMYMGTALTAVGTVATGFSGSLWTMLPCRLLVGAGSASSMTGASAYLADLSDKAPQHRAKIMGINQALVGSVWVVGPAIGGYLAEAYGFRNSFIIAGAGAALCSLGYSRLPETLRTVPKTDKEEDSDSAETKAEKGGAAATMTKDELSSLTMREHFAAWQKDVRPLLASSNQRALIALACVFPLR